VIVFDIAGTRFNYRVAAVCIEDGHVLLNRITKLGFWFLPGGRVEVNEESIEALRRELREELGVSVRIGRLIWVAESFFADVGRPFHEIALYYGVSLSADNPVVNKDAAFTTVTEAGDEVVFQWFPTDGLEDLNLGPPFLKSGLRTVPEHTQRVVDRRGVR
jgi:8-oxo-dGTP pyrophosphatase MutT (NUDIX family)